MGYFAAARLGEDQGRKSPVALHGRGRYFSPSSGPRKPLSDYQFGRKQMAIVQPVAQTKKAQVVTRASRVSTEDAGADDLYQSRSALGLKAAADMHPSSGILKLNGTGKMRSAG